MPEAVGVYVSVPFCKAKCTFCNFASEAFPPARMGAYVHRLLQEMDELPGLAARLGCEVPQSADSVYLGGGTPSLLLPEQFSRLLRALRDALPWSGDAEVTMEAAPGQIGDALLESALRAGVNRVSLGVQSFVDAESKSVGRLHTGASCLAEIARLRRAGVPRLSLDLIAGLPHQTAASWSESLQAAVASGVEHVSVYMLETDGESRLGTEVERLRAVSQMTVLGQEARYSAAAVPDDETCADLYQQACATLADVGFAQYEISNFARSGGISRHNHKYWDRAPYLGLGLDAHSMLPREGRPGVRFRNADDLDGYMAGVEPVEVIELGELDAFEEAVFLGLRRRRGVAIDELASHGQARLLHALMQRANDLVGGGLLTVDNRIILTAKGRVLSSAVFGELLTAEA